ASCAGAGELWLGGGRLALRAAVRSRIQRRRGRRGRAGNLLHPALGTLRHGYLGCRTVGAHRARHHGDTRRRPGGGPGRLPLAACEPALAPASSTTCLTTGPVA